MPGRAEWLSLEADQPEAKPHRLRGVAEVPGGERRLNRHARPIPVGGSEAVAALAGVEPIFESLARDHHESVASGFDVVAPGHGGARFAFIGGLASVQATLSNDLPRSPAPGREVLPRRRTTRRAVFVELDMAPVSVLLGAAVSRVDFDQGLAVGIVLTRPKLRSPRGSARRGCAPGGSMRNDDRLEAPLVELLEELPGCRHRLDAVGGERPDIVRRRAVRHRSRLLEVHVEIQITLTIREVDQGEQDSADAEIGGPERRIVGAPGRDGSCGHFGGSGAAKDHVLVAVVLFGGRAHLGPLPTEERHRVRAPWPHPPLRCIGESSRWSPASAAVSDSLRGR